MVERSEVVAAGGTEFVYAGEIMRGSAICGVSKKKRGAGVGANVAEVFAEVGRKKKYQKLIDRARKQVGISGACGGEKGGDGDDGYGFKGDKGGGLL